MPSLPPIFALPPELLQHIVIASASGAPPSTIAAITQTCKFLYSLVYNPTDHHLWREIFLTVFDDPRPALKHLTALHGERPAFHWEKGYKSRMRAARVMRRSNGGAPATTQSTAQHSATRSVTSQMLQERSSEIQITLRTILSVLETSLPFPSTTTIAFAPLPNSGSGIFPKYPAFPPLILLLSSSFCSTSNKSRFSRVFESTSSRWLEDLLRDGFPRVLTRRLLADPTLLDVCCGDDAMTDGGELVEGPVERGSREWAKSDEARLLYKLVAHTGFIPVCAPAKDVKASQKGASGGDVGLSQGQTSDDEDAFFTPTTSPLSVSDDPLPEIIPPTPTITPLKDASADAQFASARRMARRTVYDLRYLKPERMFGPFMPSPCEKGDEQEQSGRKTRRSRGDGDDSDDPDYVYTGTDSDGDNDSGSSGNEEDDLFPLLNLITPPDEDAPADTQLPSPHTLVPDWTWLAGARIIVEANLRDMLRRTSVIDAGPEGVESGIDEVANALRRMEGLRIGGAPGFWDNGWMVRSEFDKKGKGRAEDMFECEEGAGQGWDWAGVAGTWKRCICWLDYRDLLINNLQFGSNRFNDDTLQEALRIFPMTLRVSKYTWPPESAFSSSDNPSHTSMFRLPIIHVEGEMAGLDQEIVRYLQGTVSMIGDGAVRWSLISSRSNESPGEWSTEGVQIGGLGSALGVIGLWTGADHERTDPLGPFWLWKVG